MSSVCVTVLVRKFVARPNRGWSWTPHGEVEAETGDRRSLMEQVTSKTSEEQYVGTRFIKECLDVSRTKSYEIRRRSRTPVLVPSYGSGVACG
jgi:hypothetical protein